MFSQAATETNVSVFLRQQKNECFFFGQWSEQEQARTIDPVDLKSTSLNERAAAFIFQKFGCYDIMKIFQQEILVLWIVELNLALLLTVLNQAL